MDRTPEPELMDTAEQAEAYAIADFTAPNQRFVELFRERHPSFTAGTMVDLGCGPADIPIRLARALPDLRITAADGAKAMLDLARHAVAEARLEERIELVQGVLPNAVPGKRTFDAVISNSLLHHLHDPAVLWNEVRALAKPQSTVFVIDLLRPESKDAARAMVEKYSGNEREILKTDFYNSLLAAFTLDEIRGQLARAGLMRLKVEAISDRHLLITS
jgi:ubiquinone/menaquinone biosynthesis C-methylase UbiE